MRSSSRSVRLLALAEPHLLPRGGGIPLRPGRVSNCAGQPRLQCHQCLGLHRTPIKRPVSVLADHLSGTGDNTALFMVHH